MLFVLTSILLSISAVQTKLGKIVTSRINEDFNTNITVHKVDFSLLSGNVRLKGIEILDHHLDSMIFVERLSTSVNNFRKVLKSNLNFGSIELEGVDFFIKTYKGEDQDAFMQFIASFDDEEKDSIPSNFLMTSNEVKLIDVNVKIIDENKSDKALTFNKISGRIGDLDISGPNFSGFINGFRFVENHGIQVENLTSDFSYSREEMNLLNTTLETESSSILADITFFRNGSFADFNNKVTFEAEVHKGDVSLKDLNNFYGGFGVVDVLHFKTSISGTLNDFKANGFRLKTDLQTIVNGDFHVINSFDVGDGFSINADLSSLVSDYDNLRALLPNVLSKSVPSIIEELGRFDISGKSFITNEIIDANIQMNTDIGSLIANLKLTNIDNIDNASYKGHVEVVDFELGIVIKDPLIGKMSFDADIDGYGFTLENLNTKIVGIVHEHQYKGYNYGNIDIDGRIQNKKFEGELIIVDENLNLNFNGLADFSKAIYKFDFRTTVKYANFNKLNLYSRDSISVLKGDIEIDLMGNTIDDLIGSINFNKVSYKNQNDNYYFEEFNISSILTDSIRTVSINSTDIIEGSIKGDFTFVEMPKLARNAFGSIYSNYEPYQVRPGQHLDFRFNIYDKIVDVFFPEVKLAPNSFLRGSINSDEDDFKLTIRSSKIEVYGNIIDDIYLQIDNKNPLFNTQLTIENVDTKGYDISNLSLVNVTLNDTLFFRTEFVGGENNLDSYSLGFYHTIDENNKSILGINKSELNFKDTKWLLNPNDNIQNKIVFDSEFKQFDFQEFEMISGIQKIGFNGLMSGKNDKDFKLTLDNVDLEGITPDVDKWDFTGVVNGDLVYTEDIGGVLPVANIKIDDFTVNGSYQGDFNIGMRGRNSSKTYSINLSIEDNGYDTLFANGILDFVPEEPTIDLAFEFEKFKLDILQPIGKQDFTNMRGQIYGSARLSGLLGNPDMNGEFYIFDGGLAMPYLNVDYDFEGTTVVELHDQSFEIIDLTLKDHAENTRGTLLGSISHNYFSDWKLDLKLETDNLLILNTVEEEESLYYGKGFIDGQATIIGYTDNITIDVVGKTNKGTHFVIPMSSTKVVGNSNLVNFITKDEKKELSTLQNEILLKNFKGLALNFNLDVTKDAIIELVLDKDTGSMLKGSGTGALLIEIDLNGKFNMYGDFVIDNGIYNFNYRDVINKKFKATRGGSISWNGSPYEADIDIETIIRVYANPKYLLENVYTSRDIAVDLVARFTGDLFDSKQEYDILIPDADSDLKAELDFKLNGSNDISTKMNNWGSLLIFGTFNNGESTFEDNSRMLIAGITEEVLSNALTNLVNTGNNNFEVGLTYDIGDARSDIDNLQTDDQLGITVATQLNDRILIDGKLGVPVGTSNQSGIIGEVEVEFLLNPEGTLRSNVFNRQNEIQYSEEEEGYTQGAGISYRFDFDNAGEFLEKIGLKKKKPAEQKKETTEQKIDSIPVKKSIVGFKKSTNKKKSI